VCLMDLFLPCRVLEVVRRNFHAMSFSGLVPPLPGSTGFLQMRAVKSPFIGYYEAAGWLYPHLYILFFVVCDDGMTRNRLQENGILRQESLWSQK
jgi:hypothetical protein